MVMETRRVLREVEAARRVHEGSLVYLGLYIPELGPDRSLFQWVSGIPSSGVRRPGLEAEFVSERGSLFAA
jgi:hypothetical protein